MSDLVDTAVTELVDAHPAWTAADDPISQLGIVLAAEAASIDTLANQAEQVYANTRLATADREAMLEEWAWLHDVDHEQLPPTVDGLRAYLQAVQAEDGSVGALTRTLTGLIDTDANTTGTQLSFDAGGAGLTFPADGRGLLLFQTTPATDVLVFPLAGGGLTFPADGDGLAFGTLGWFDITEHSPAGTFTVTTKSYLVFDRAAVARAIDRFRAATALPPTYTETNA